MREPNYRGSGYVVIGMGVLCAILCLYHAVTFGFL